MAADGVGNTSMSAEKDLIKFINKHASQKMDFEDMETGVVSSMSRSEALSLVMWKLAHGHAVYVDTTSAKGVTTKKLVNYYPPDKSMINQLFDRLIGKPKAAAVKQTQDKGPRGVPVTKKVGDTLDKFRCLKGGGSEKSGSKGTTKTDARESISAQIRKLGVSRDGAKCPEEPSKKRRMEIQITE